MNVSTTDKLGIFLKTPFATFSALAALVGLTLFLTFLPSTDFKAPLFWTYPTALAEGHIVDVAQTNLSTDKSPIMRFHFRFSTGGRAFSSFSYSSTLRLKPGDKVWVEYIALHPAHARIQGTDCAPFSLWGLLFAGLVATWGLSQVKKGAVETGDVLAIISSPTTVMAIQAQKRNTLMEVNDRTLYELMYHYEFNGQRYSHSFRTTSPTGYGPEEAIYINQAAPEKAVLATNLPAGIREKLRLSKA
jgi:hypothetical protein